MKYKLFIPVLLSCFVNLPAIACNDDGPCEHRKYGHRRALLRNPEVFILPNDENAQGVTTPYKDYFEQVAAHAMKLRAHLIITGALEKSNENETEIRRVAAKAIDLDFDDFSPESLVYISRTTPTDAFCKKVERKVQEIKEAIASKKQNIASFGFVFFDQNGQPINENPFHFFPSVKAETSRNLLEAPYFFLSGRRQRNFEWQNGNPDPSRWTALPQNAPTCFDLSFMPSLATKILETQSVTVLFQHTHSMEEQDHIVNTQQTLKQSFNNYTATFKRALVKKTQKYPFFDYIYKRHQRLEQTSESKVCPSLLPVLKLPYFNLPTNFYYPSNPDKQNPNQEGDFTHSEQWALFASSYRKMPNSPTAFELFIDACVRSLASSITEEKTVDSYAVLIYSYNVICARCAHSIIGDFTVSYEQSENDRRNPRALPPYTSLSQIINKKLDANSPEPLQRPMVFMAGYSKAYRSRLYEFPKDYFESLLPEDGDAQIPHDKTLGKPYKQCSPKNNPQVIYHVKIANHDV